MMSFLLMTLGICIQMNFIYKIILITIGFCLILAVRDSIEVYFKEKIFNIFSYNEYKKMLTYLNLYRKIGTVILGSITSLILTKFAHIYSILILLFCSVIIIGLSNSIKDKFK
ncbi:hypothetical protein D3C73_1139610 [compost metagenome]